ncbi:MAG: WD40 repeat domain-containing protein [Candidatus Babeliales bacterium]
MKKLLFFLFLLFYIFNSKNLYSKSTLAGTSSIQYVNNHLVFHDEGINGYNMVQGFVRLNSGFTVLSTCTAFLDTFISVSGDIDLRNTGQIELLSDLHLEPSVTFTGAGGMINGRGNVIYLDNNLNLPDNYILNITGNTIIDGNGHDLTLGKWANITVDDSVTLTLRNLTLKNTYTTYTVPPIIPYSIKSMVTFDNIEISLFDDFSFNQGKLFIHNDVDVTGTYKFSYRSTQPMLIESNSCLYFDKNSTFEFYPSCTNNSLFNMQDKSSTLYLDGCTLQTTHTGIILTKGQLFLDNNVTFSSIDNTYLYDLNYQSSINYGTLKFSPQDASQIKAAAWSPNGIYMAIGGTHPTIINDSLLKIYRFDGYNFKFITSNQYYENVITTSGIFSLSWHPSGKYLAVGGHTEDTGCELKIYSFDGSNLTSLNSQSPSLSYVFATSWRPDGKYLAIGGSSSATSNNDFIIYNFNNQNLTITTSVNFEKYNSSPAQLNCAQWNPNGNYIAVGGYRPNHKINDAFQNLLIYNFNSSSLNLVDYAIFTGTYGWVFTNKWSSDGNYLAEAGTADNYLRIYAFRYTTQKISYIDAKVPGSDIITLDFSQNGQFVIEGGGFNRNFNFYNFTGNSLIQATSLSKYFGFLQSVISPNGKFLAAAGQPNSPLSEPELKLYKLNFKYDTTPQALSHAIKLGNSQLGTDYDLDINLLADNYNKLYGSIFYDNVN